MNLRRATLTHAQNIAGILGTTMVDALVAYKNALQAVTDEGLPDHKVRLMAAKQITLVWGGYAPQEYKVDAKHEHAINVSMLTEEQIDAKIIELRPLLEEHGVAELIPATVKTRNRASSRRPREREEGYQGGEGHPLLADSMHEDERRAG